MMVMMIHQVGPSRCGSTPGDDDDEGDADVDDDGGQSLDGANPCWEDATFVANDDGDGDGDDVECDNYVGCDEYNDPTSISRDGCSSRIRLREGK